MIHGHSSRFVQLNVFLLCLVDFVWHCYQHVGEEGADFCVYLFIYLFNTCAVCRILFALSFGVIGGQDYACRYVY